MNEEAEYPPPRSQVRAQPKRRRRVYLTAPSGYTLHRLVWIAAGAAACWGAVLGDNWLWRLLYG